ncbi:hypothetical protein [Alkalibacterium sp. 20]|uniref:hypothetical protein n=1 Tax=Alkalibacterium sp. 20 TaxID=1798803 RepID=UPI000ABF9FD3
MIRVLIGDIEGSRFEASNHESKAVDFFTADCRPTDDSIMALAVGKTILEAEKKGFICESECF